MTSRVTAVQRVSVTAQDSWRACISRFSKVSASVFMALMAEQFAGAHEWWTAGVAAAGSVIWALLACVASTLTVTIGGDDAAG